VPDRPAGLLPREFLNRPAPEVAPGLLGCVLEHESPEGLVAVRLTEVEAYNGEGDAASHAARGRTARNAVMYGPPGHAYVYFTYGMHFCVNVVCMTPGTASAVLMRAGAVITGEDLARRRRPVKGPPRDLARGPARLCQALGIDRAFNGADFCDPASPVRLRTRIGPVEESAICTGPRVGVSAAATVPWRFWLDGEPSVSVYRPWVPRRRTERPI
jgi:DNA-3-methyladenine glycosylase